MFITAWRPEPDNIRLDNNILNLIHQHKQCIKQYEHTYNNLDYEE